MIMFTSTLSNLSLTSSCLRFQLSFERLTISKLVVEALLDEESMVSFHFYSFLALAVTSLLPESYSCRSEKDAVMVAVAKSEAQVNIMQPGSHSTWRSSST